MKIYVLSDSHNSFVFAGFLELIKDGDMVIHCGDGARDIEDLISVAACPVYGVKGNCDISGKPFQLIECEGHRIFVTHGDRCGVKYSLDMLLNEADKFNADIVLYGHTHVPDISFINNKIVINPGSLTRPRDGKVCTYCVLTVEGDKVYPQLKEF